MKNEKDPNGLSANQPGAKLDFGKAKLSIILPPFGRALGEVAKVGEYGANKYSLHGWESVPDGITRYTDAMFRHALEEHIEKCDGDTEIMHAAHCAWNALARLELMIRNGFSRSVTADAKCNISINIIAEQQKNADKVIKEKSNVHNKSSSKTTANRRKKAVQKTAAKRRTR